LAAIAALHAASWRAAYRGLLSDQYLNADIAAERLTVWAERLHHPAANQYVVVAEEGGTVAGFACAYLGADPHWGALLDNVHVSAAHQRRGVGRSLMRAVALQCTTAAGAPGLYLWVLQANTAACGFYERLGASRSGDDLWTPPGGGTLARFRYAWRDAR